MKYNPICKMLLSLVLLLSASRLFAFPFSDNADGTVSDSTTGLIWQKCSMGQNNDSTCSGSATTGNWAAALNYCKNLNVAGKSWRLPSENELKTLVDRSKASGTMIDSAFPSAVAGYYYTSTTYAAGASAAWYVNFQYGILNGVSKGTLAYVRCVTGP